MSLFSKKKSGPKTKPWAMFINDVKKGVSVSTHKDKTGTNQMQGCKNIAILFLKGPLTGQLILHMQIYF